MQIVPGNSEFFLERSHQRRVCPCTCIDKSRLEIPQDGAHFVTHRGPVPSDFSRQPQQLDLGLKTFVDGGAVGWEDVLTLEQQVRGSVAQGARVLTGGTRPDRPGFFYAPTVLSGVRDGMPVLEEETFGPVAAVRRVADADEAVTVANRSAYGLGAAVWTADVRRGEKIARSIESGAVFVNGMVASDPRLPFGGVKRSGYGRELGPFGIREFTNIQTIWIGPATAPGAATTSE